MNQEWSLDILYQGYEDIKYKKDQESLSTLIDNIKEFSNTLTKESAKEEENLVKAIDFMEEYQLLYGRLSRFVYLKHSVNTSDSITANERNAMERMNSQATKPFTVMKKFIASITNLTTYMDKYPKLKEYEFLFQEIKEEAGHLLSDDIEDVIAKLNLSAGSAWGKMHNYLTSTLEVEFRGTTVTLPQIRNMAYSEDAATRKEAYEAELKALEKIKDAMSFSLNNIKTQVITVSGLRGYESPLAMTLEQSRMKKETLEALLQAIQEYLPVFHAYLKHKAKLLGHQGSLPWYDLFAPIGESNTKFTIEASKDYLVNHFRGFTDDLADLVEGAFEDAWIDFYPRKGKVGGAFCVNMPALKQSRVLTNFDGSLSDVVTLAHELGHAYHGLHIQEHLPLNVHYSMPVAETASTFNEALIMEAAIHETNGRERIALIESQLQDVTQIICDIYSRFLFESEVFEKNKTGFLFADELKTMMLEAQKKAYGDGLDQETLHPYMWVVKNHYYQENRNFYNFPYAFGGLFARGLYAKYKQEGEGFVPKYQALLRATTVMSVEAAAREAEINLEDPNFWRTSLESVKEMIEEFIQAAV